MMQRLKKYEKSKQNMQHSMIQCHSLLVAAAAEQVRT